MQRKHFELEAELVEFALPFLPKLLRQPKTVCHIHTEVGVGRRVADVVALVTSRSLGKLPTQPPTLAESVILSTLRQQGPTRIDILEERCGVEREAYRNGALNRLSDSGFLDVSRGGRVAACSKWHEQSAIIAVEAKLTRWREALQQAIDNTRFADQSFVLLPEEYAGPALRSIQEFADNGVGLWIATSDGINKVQESEESTDHCWRREFVCSRLALATPP